MNKPVTMFTTFTDNNHIIVCKNQLCSSCVIDKFLITKQIRIWGSDASLLRVLVQVQNLHHINQRKAHFLTPRSSSAHTLPDQRPLYVFSELCRAAFPLLPSNCRNRCWSSCPWSGGHGTSCRRAGRSTRWGCS